MSLEYFLFPAIDDVENAVCKKGGNPFDFNWRMIHSGVQDLYLLRNDCVAVGIVVVDRQFCEVRSYSEKGQLVGFYHG